MPKEMADILRRAITKSGLSGAELGRLTGVPQQTVSDFMAGKDIRLATANKLARYLGLELRPKKSR